MSVTTPHFELWNYCIIKQRPNPTHWPIALNNLDGVKLFFYLTTKIAELSSDSP